jgi:DNA repair protein RadC
MAFKDIPIGLRPREKLLAHGAGALQDVELLALLLRTGTPGASVLQLAQRLLDEFKGVAGLLQADLQGLSRIKGIGPAKRAELAAVLEIARRALLGELRQRPLFDTPDKVKDFLRLKLASLGHEVFAVLLLDAKHHLIEYRELFRGTLTQTSVYPREVVKLALATNAAAIVFAHNHPSGVAEPSRSDETLTQALVAALALIDVRVLDHLVVGSHEVVSMAERGLM